MTITSNGDTTNGGIVDVTTYVDSDWAGCTTTRKSTSGCTITGREIAVRHELNSMGAVRPYMYSARVPRQGQWLLAVN